MGRCSQLGSATPLTFSHVYGDGMVLQQAPHAASVWGWAEPGAKVTVTIGSEEDIVSKVSAETRADGAWRVSLPAQPASTKPVSITAKDGSSTVVLSDVLFGDVYVCSGQSSTHRSRCVSR
jgi:sialate O-acetylesterase